MGEKKKKIDKFHHPSKRNNNNKNKNKKDGQEPKDLNTHKEEKYKTQTNLDESRFDKALLRSIAHAPQLNVSLDDVRFLGQSVSKMNAREFASAERFGLDSVLEFQIVGSQVALHRVHGETGVERETGTEQVSS